MCDDASPPLNFSWVVAGELCAMAWPHEQAELRYLVAVGVGHLVTLSCDHQPPAHDALRNTLIDVAEFEPPSLAQIQQFIAICEHASHNKQAVGVHCRMGRGRTGVMAACYLLRFHEQRPERAVTNVRLMRPGSVETYAQERAVAAYYDHLRSCS